MRGKHHGQVQSKRFFSIRIIIADCSVTPGEKSRHSTVKGGMSGFGKAEGHTEGCSSGKADVISTAVHFSLALHASVTSP